ncbi:MAG: chorismate mutase [Bryobacteraceae bacterium]|nr:chorismate mutase [Bryobacteraceae bacterium]
MTEALAREELGKFRAQIDEVDGLILSLLNRRAKIAEQIGDIKRAAGLPVVELSRESAVVENMAARNQGPLTDFSVAEIYRAIMLEMRRIQEVRAAQVAKGNES